MSTGSTVNILAQSGLKVAYGVMTQDVVWLTMTGTRAS
jgi:hypothetical protein